MGGTRGAGAGSKAINGKGSSGTNSGGMSSIPQGSKKMLQSLKEIVDCPETEIYAMLKECDMDPNETVSRLLSQDQFHQVKSKKEKKKENKDATGLSSRSTGGGTVNRGFRGGNDRYSHAILLQFSPCESVGLPAKPSYKKDNWITNISSSSPGVVGNNINWMPPAVSEASVEGNSLTVNNSEGVSSLQHASDFRSPWSGVTGQVSMADIVKMGRPQVSAEHHVAESQFAPTPQELYSSQTYVNKANLGLGRSQDVPEIDEWPQDDQPLQVIHEPYEDASRHRNNYHLNEVQCADDAEPASVVPSKMQDECSGDAHILNDEFHDGTDSYKIPQSAYGDREVEDIAVSVSSVLTNVQQLSLSKEEDNSPEERETPVVKIPDHLQVRSSDCSYLSFGSFGSVMTAPLSGPPECDVEETSTAADAQSLGHTDSRNSYENERTVSGGGTYSASQSETLKQGVPEAVVVAYGNEYSFPSPPNNTFENSQHWNPSLSLSQISSQVRNLPQLSGIMSYPNSMRSNLLPSNNVHTDRDDERSYSPFPYSDSVSGPINVPSATMNEAVKTGNFSSPHPTQRQTFPQHLPVHPYSQPSLQFPNMISYSLLPQSYAYMPTAFQQAITATTSSNYHVFQQAIAAAAGNNTYLSSVVPPQYKNSVSASGLPQSATVPLGYGVFGNSTTNPTASSVNYEDILRSQYKDAAHLLSLQQGGGSRTMGGVPGSAYYSIQEQSHQYNRQSQQQPSQAHQYASLGLGYPTNFYHSQTGIPLDHQRQQMMSRDGSVMSPQGQQQAKEQQQQAQQMWQNSY